MFCVPNKFNLSPLFYLIVFLVILSSLIPYLISYQLPMGFSLSFFLMQSCCYDEYEKVMRVLMIFIPERLPEQHSFDKFIFSSATFDLFIYSIFTLN